MCALDQTCFYIVGVCLGSLESEGGSLVESVLVCVISCMETGIRVVDSGINTVFAAAAS